MWIDSSTGKRRPDCKRTRRQAELNSHAARVARGGRVSPLNFPHNWGRESAYESRIIRPPKRLIVTPQEAAKEVRRERETVLAGAPGEFARPSLRERLARGVQNFNPVHLARRLGFSRKTG